MENVKKHMFVIIISLIVLLTAWSFHKYVWTVWDAEKDSSEKLTKKVEELRYILKGNVHTAAEITKIKNTKAALRSLISSGLKEMRNHSDPMLQEPLMQYTLGDRVIQKERIISSVLQLACRLQVNTWTNPIDNQGNSKNFYFTDVDGGNDIAGLRDYQGPLGSGNTTMFRQELKYHHIREKLYQDMHDSNINVLEAIYVNKEQRVAYSSDAYTKIEFKLVLRCTPSHVRPLLAKLTYADGNAPQSADRLLIQLSAVNIKKVRYSDETEVPVESAKAVKNKPALLDNSMKNLVNRQQREWPTVQLTVEGYVLDINKDFLNRQWQPAKDNPDYYVDPWTMLEVSAEEMRELRAADGLTQN